MSESSPVSPTLARAFSIAGLDLPELNGITFTFTLLGRRRAPAAPSEEPRPANPPGRGKSGG